MQIYSYWCFIKYYHIVISSPQLDNVIFPYHHYHQINCLIPHTLRNTASILHILAYFPSYTPLNWINTYAESLTICYPPSSSLPHTIVKNIAIWGLVNYALLMFMGISFAENRTGSNTYKNILCFDQFDVIGCSGLLEDWIVTKKSTVFSIELSQIRDNTFVLFELCFELVPFRFQIRTEWIQSFIDLYLLSG